MSIENLPSTIKVKLKTMSLQDPILLPPARRRAALAVTPGQLRTFAAVAELGSVRAAAERLQVTESAVSAAIGALQRQLGASLLERQGRGIRLTAAGARYADYARRVLGMLEEAAAAALAEADPRRGRLRVAAVTSAGEVLLPPLLAAFRRRWPEVALDLEVAARDRVWQLLRDHAVDLAVAGRPPADMDVVTYARRANELIVVAAPGLVSEAEDLRRIPWLLREPGSGTRETLEAVLEAIGAGGPRLTLGSNGAVVAGAVAGIGATLASRDAVAVELAARRLVVVETPATPLDRPYHLVGRRHLPATARRFVDDVLAHGGWVVGGEPGTRRPRTGAASRRRLSDPQPGLGDGGAR